MLDGVFTADGDGPPVFRRTPRVTTLDVEEVLATIEPLVGRRLRAHGRVGVDDPDVSDPWVEEAPVLAGFAAASVQNRSALGEHPGARPGRLGYAGVTPAEAAPTRCQARANGYSLHAGLVIPAGQREQLERVCRYALRPPVAAERLHLTEDGQVRLSLRRPWNDGTTDLLFTPLAFLERLAVLVPRPRVNLLLYFGVLGARAARRAEMVARARTDAPGEAPCGDDVCPAVRPCGPLTSFQTR